MSGYEYTPWILPLLASAALQVALTVYLWGRRRTAGALPLAAVMLVAALWCLTDAGELAASQLPTREAWFLVRDALALPAMTVSLWFTLEYAGLQRLLTRPVVTVLVGAVIVLLPLYLVDDGRLLWTRLWEDGTVRGDIAPVGAAFGVYGYAIALLATGILLVLFVRSPAHRVPVALILLGQIGVRVAYPLGLLNVAAVPNIESMALAVDFASLMYVVALLRFRLFDLAPVARETILARMPDGLIVLDMGGRIVDVNEAALRMLGVERRAAVDRPAATVVGAFAALASVLASPAPSAEAAFETASEPRRYQVTSTPLADWQGRPIGRLVLLHDITELRTKEAQLVERERALASATERERLARELHDGLAQDLWLAKLKITRLAAQPGLGPDVRALTEEVLGAVDAGIAETRQAVATMRSTNEATDSLRALLSRALVDFEDRFGLAVEFEDDGALPRLSARGQAETLRIVGEALTNVRRHADATVVRVRALADDGQLVLEVRDNGRGFDPGSVREAAYGLVGMRERAAQIGAEFRIESAPRKGTCIAIRVPAGVDPPTEVGPSLQAAAR